MNDNPEVRAAEKITWDKFRIFLPLGTTFTSQEIQEQNHPTSTEKKQKNQPPIKPAFQHKLSGQLHQQ